MKCRLFLLNLRFFRRAELVRHHGRAEYFGEYKFMASVAERIGCFLFTKPKNHQALLAQAHRESGEITVTGYQAETIESSRVQQVHRIDNQRAVRGIFPGRISKLLNRLDCVSLQHLFPRRTGWGSEISVNPPDSCFPKSRYLGEQPFNDGGLGIVGINKNSQSKSWLFGFDFCH